MAKVQQISQPLKVPPQNIQAEQWVLMACIVREEIIPQVQKILKQDDFYREAHSVIFEAVCEIKKGVDLVTVAQKLREKNQLERAGGEQYLTELIDPRLSVGWEHHAKIVKELSVRRQIINACSLTADMCFQSWQETDEILSSHKQSLIEIQSDATPDYEIPSKIASEVNEIISERSAKQDYTLGPLTGFTDIDERFHGFERSQTYYLKGKSRSGKSALALNVCDNILEKHKGIGLYFTLEADRHQLWYRRISTLTRIPLTRILMGKLFDESEWEIFTHALTILEQSGLLIFDKSKYQRFEAIRSECETQATKQSLLFVVVDFLQLLSLQGKFNTRHHELSALTNQFNFLAKDVNCPVIILSQINKEGEAKESGDIQNNASHVWNWDREPEDRTGTLYGEKGKNIGTWGPIKLNFDRHTQRFMDWREEDNGTSPNT